VLGVESFISFFFSKQNISSKEIFEDIEILFYWFFFFCLLLRDTIEQKNKIRDD
jgi:hypothetical protein